MDLVLWKTCQHTRNQHIWIPLIPLRHKTDSHVTHKQTMPFPRAPAEKDHPEDPNQPEEWEKATAPHRDTARCASGLRTPDNDLPHPPTDSPKPLLEVWCTVLERGDDYVASATASPGPKWVLRGTDSILAPGTTPSEGVGETTIQHRVFRGIVHPGD